MAITLELPSLTDQLRKTVARIEALEAEKAEIGAALKEAFTEAKQEGLDVKALKEVLKLRKAEHHEVVEQRTTLQNYLHAMNMI